MKLNRRLTLAGMCWLCGLGTAYPDNAASAGHGESEFDHSVKGANFNFYKVDLSAVPLCPTAGPGVTIAAAPRLSAYQDFNVRSISRSDLETLRAKGVNWIRSMVWFAYRPLPIGFVIGQSGRQAVLNLKRMGTDIGKHGIANWVIAFAPLADASPACKQKDWGDCFNEASIDTSINFILSTRAGIPASGFPDLWIDLSSEACPADVPDSTTYQRLLSNQRKYLVPLVRKYVSRFPDDRITVSCIGDRFLAGRIDNMMKIFAEAGATPDFLDAHIYSDSAASIESPAKELAQRSVKSGIPFIVGETQINRPDIQAALTTAFAAAAAEPKAIISWPVKYLASGCHADQTEIPD